MQMIVELADGVWKGDVISVLEITHRSRVDGQRSPYRNVWVLIRIPDGSTRSFRASKIDGDWQLDEEEVKRLDHLRKLDPKNVNWSNIR